MDPLSDVLSLLGTGDSHFAGLKAGGRWAIHFPPPIGMKFNAVVDGACSLRVEGVASDIRLQRGDCFLLSRPRRFTLASDLDETPVDAADVFKNTDDGVAVHGSGNDVFLIGGAFAFSEEAARLLEVLPPIVVVNGTSAPASVLQWALQRLSYELGHHRPGASLMSQHLGHMMLVEVLRLHIAKAADNPVGWLFALSDTRIKRSIEAIHAAPARKWNLNDLAAVAGVSRSTFAARFKQKVGHSPLDYVVRWRIHLAACELRLRDATVTAIAQKLGYESDSAFSSTFRRVMDCSPTAYRRRASDPLESTAGGSPVR